VASGEPLNFYAVRLRNRLVTFLSRAQSKGKAELEQEVESARASAMAQGERLHASADAKKDELSTSWDQLQRSWLGVLTKFL